MTESTTQPNLSEKQRATLSALADELVPADLGMPAASDVDVPGKGIDRALRARPDLAPDLIDVLDRAADEDPVEALPRLNEEAPEAVASVGTLVTGAYYLDPEVRELLGYPGQESKPPLPDESDHYLRGGILDPVRERGPIYRPTPE